MNTSSSKNDILFILFFPVVSFLYMSWTWNPELAGLGGDNAIYLLTAKFFSPWSETSSVARYFVEHSQYPPLYPLVLAIFGGGESILAAHLITTACLLLAFIVIRFWLISIGLQKTTANLAVLLMALLPGTVKITMFILSENLYILLSSLALYLVFLSEKKNSTPLLLTAAVVIACSALTRTVGVSLTAAFCLYLAVKKPVRGLMAGFTALTPLALYFWYENLNTTEHTGYLDDLIFHYSSDTVMKIVEQVQNGSLSLWRGWHYNFDPRFAGFIISLFLIISLMALAFRIYKRKLDGYYLAFYFTIVLLWPFPAEAKRFIYAVLPIMVGQCLSLVNYLPSFNVKQIKFLSSSAVIVALFIISLPNTIIIADRFLQPLPAELENYRRTKHLYTSNLQIAAQNMYYGMTLVEDMKKLDSKLPENAIIYSIKPSIISLYSNRLSLLPPNEIPDDNFLQFEGSTFQPTFFYMTAITSPSIREAYYPLEKIRDRIEILDVTKIQNREDAPIMAILARLNK